MPFKDFTDGPVLYAADVNKYWIQQHSIIKSADQTRSNTTTLADSELIVPLLANNQYWVEFFLITTNAASTADFKFSWTGPASATFDWSHGGLALSATSSIAQISRLYRSIADTGTAGVVAGVDSIIPGYGRVVTSGTAGNLTLNWAQNTLDAANGTTLKANSVLILQRLTV